MTLSGQFGNPEGYFYKGWNDYVNGFAARMTSGDGDAAKVALDIGLVDQLLTRSQANDYLAELVGARNNDGLYEAVPFEQFSRKSQIHAK